MKQPAPFDIDFQKKRPSTYPSFHTLSKRHRKNLNPFRFPLQQPKTLLERLRLPKRRTRLLALPSHHNHAGLPLIAFARRNLLVRNPISKSDEPRRRRRVSLPHQLSRSGSIVQPLRVRRSAVAEEDSGDLRDRRAGRFRQLAYGLEVDVVESSLRSIDGLIEAFEPGFVIGRSGEGFVVLARVPVCKK